MQRIIDFLSSLRSLVSDLVVTILAVTLVVVLIRQLTSSTVVVEPLQVPPDLVDTGYTPEVATQRLMDGMFDIQRTATTQQARKLVAPEWQRFDMEVPGSGVTLGTVGRALRESLGIREKKISGDIVSSQTGLHLRLRYWGDTQFRWAQVSDQQDVDALIAASAERAVQLMAPFMFASYLHATGQSEALVQALEYCLQYGEAEDFKWVYNLRGVIQADQEDWKGAITWYAQALEIDPEFAIAQHNWANALYELRQYELALEKLLLAVRLDPGLDDAKKEAGFRVQAGRAYGGDPQQRQQEIAMYRLALQRNPQETLALLSWGIALMQPPEPDLEAAADKFAAVINQDQANIMAYLKWGEVLEKLGDNRAAISKYQAVLALNAEDYQWLPEQIEQLQAMSGGEPPNSGRLLHDRPR
jgi:tetratricopeptide (TPR) repeat protein